MKVSIIYILKKLFMILRLNLMLLKDLNEIKYRIIGFFEGRA